MGREIDKLAETLDKRMRQSARRNNTTIAEIGQITAKLGLTVPSVTNEIGKSDYLVCRDLKLGKKDEKLTETKPAGGHSHDVKVPEQLEELKEGDTVLVIWAGFEPVIVAVLAK